MEHAVLDACVLWPSLQRDFLLELAARGGYRAAWSTEVLREVRRNENEKLIRHGIPEQEAGSRADALIQNMRSAFPRAEVTGYEHRQGRYGLPDPNDEHVVAAADHADLRTIVTENVKDFPSDRLPPGTETVSAREFARRVVESNPREALRATDEIAKRSGRHGPKMSVDDVIDQLEQRYKMTEAADVLRQARGSRDASASLAQPARPEQQQRQGRTERRRGGPPAPRLARDRSDRHGGRQDRGRGGREGPRTP